MAKSKRPRVYWDACIFLALLKNETAQHGEQAIRHMEEMYQSCLDAKLEIVTSALWRFEVLLDQNSETDTHLENAFYNEVFLSVAATEEVFIKALGIRKLLGKKNLLLADTIHVATALVTECSVLYSVDHHILKCAGLIPGLPIEKPRADANLFDEV